MELKSHVRKVLNVLFFLVRFFMMVAYRTCWGAATEGRRKFGIVETAGDGLTLEGADRLSLAREARHLCVEAIFCGVDVRSPATQQEGRIAKRGSIAHQLLLCCLAAPKKCLGLQSARR